jgi:arylsulfatase
MQGRPTADTQTVWGAEKARGFIEAFAEEPYPWLLSVNLFDPHAPFDPPQEFLEPYLVRLDEIPLPAFRPGELEMKPEAQKRWHNQNRRYTWSEMNERDHRLIRAAYWAMCDLIDAQVGRILTTLECTGQRENTLILFMSDHGEMLGDHGLYIKGPFLYDAAVRVPLLVSLPGTIAGGRRVSGLVELADIAPTLLEATGLPRHPGMQGKSFWSLLTGESPYSGRDDIYCEYYNSNPDKPAQYRTMVRTAEHKIIRDHGTDTGELYDLQQDPGEHDNLWETPNAQALKTEMLLRLADRMAQTADPLPPRIGVY